MAKFADIPWYTLVNYLETLEIDVDPSDVEYEHVSTSSSTMHGAMNIFVTRGISQSLNLYAKNENSDYKGISFEIPYDWKQDNIIKLKQNIVYEVKKSDTVKRTVSENSYYQVTYDYLQDDLFGEIEQSDEIYSRKDSALNQWVIDNWEDYEGEINPHLTFMYIGDGYTRNGNILEIHYWALKDWMKSALPTNNRSQKFDEFLDIIFDKVFNKVYNRQKNIINLIDPVEIEEEFFELMFSFYNVEPFVSLEEQYRVRLFLNNLIFLLKKRGTYSSLFIIWHILSEGTGNNLTIYDRWHEPAETVPLSAFEDFDYTSYYKDGYDYPELYSLSNKILSTHYKVEFDLNNNPFMDSYIINKNISNDLYNKFEDLRPITRVSHYHELLNLDYDLSGREIPLYEDSDFDANLYSESNIVLSVGVNNYVHNQDTNSNIWNINHNLDTKNLIIETYILENNIFKHIEPKEIKVETRNLIKIRFDDYVSGTALITKSDYNQSKGKSWIINYNLNTEQIFYEVYDQNNELIIPQDAEITNNGNTLILTFDQITTGRCIVKSIQNSELKYVHDQSTYSTDWTINHNLNFSDVIYEVYNENGEKIVPDTVYSTNDILYITFTEEVRGKCLIYIDISYTHTQATESDLWAIEHNMNTDEVFYELYDGNYEIIYPETFEIVDENNILLTLSEPTSGICVLNRIASHEYERFGYIEHDLEQKFPISQYYYWETAADRTGTNWEIDYNLDTENIIFEIYDEHDYMVFPINAAISSNGNKLTVYWDSITYGKCIIKSADDALSSYVHEQSTANSTWEINHGIGQNVLYEVYDSNNYRIYPKSADSNENTLWLNFSKSTVGKCVIIGDVQYEHEQTDASEYWTINHDLNTRNVYFEAYNNDGLTIYPSEAMAINLNNLILSFGSPTSGRCVIGSNSSYTFYNYREATIDSLLRYYSQIGDVITALDENNLDVDLINFNKSENYIVQVATVNPSAASDEIGYGYIHEQTELSSEWEIHHNLGTVGIILDVYDTNDDKVIPTDIYLIDQNTCKVFLSESISGTCSIRAIGTPRSGPFITSGFDGDFKIKFGYTEDDTHDYLNDIANPIDEFTTWCNASNVIELEDKIEISMMLPVGIEGYFNEIGIFNTENNMIFYTTGSSTYKYNNININFKFTINFEEL